MAQAPIAVAARGLGDSELRRNGLGTGDIAVGTTLVALVNPKIAGK